MSRPWLSDGYKPSSKSPSKSPDDRAETKKRTRLDDFGRSVPAKSSRSRSRSRSREGLQRRSIDRGRGRYSGGNRRADFQGGSRDRAKRESSKDSKKRRKRSESSSSSGSSSDSSFDKVRPAASEKPRYKKARLFVANINSKETPKDALVKHFEKYGKVADLLIHPKNYAFVQYMKEEHARLAVEGENGSTFQGCRMDVKMAFEGKRDFSSGPRGGGRSRGSRGQYGGRGGQRGGDWGGDPGWSAGRDEPPFDEGFRPGGPRPPPPGPHARYPGEFGMRDPYYPPPPPDPYRRGFPDPWYPPPDDPYRLDPYADPYRDPLAARAPAPAPAPAPPPPPAKVECEIFVVSSKLRAYGEAIEELVKENCILTAVTVMTEGRTASQMLEDLADRDGLFAVFVNAQNETHRSLTLNILHGTPQEHRNMPMKDAVALIGRSFEEYVDKLREKANAAANPPTAPPAAPPAPAPAPAVSATKPEALAPSSRVFLPPSSEVVYLLNLLADNRALTVSELDDVIAYLQARRKKLVDAEKRPLASDEQALVPTETKSEGSKAPAVNIPDTDELTHKILSIFSSAGGNLQSLITASNSSGAAQKQPQPQEQQQRQQKELQLQDQYHHKQQQQQPQQQQQKQQKLQDQYHHQQQQPQEQQQRQQKELQLQDQYHHKQQQQQKQQKLQDQYHHQQQQQQQPQQQRQQKLQDQYQQQQPQQQQQQKQQKLPDQYHHQQQQQQQQHPQHEQPAPPSSHKPAPPPPPPSQPRPRPPEPPSSSAASMINFDNPNVQRALDDLIQSSPVLMKTFGAGVSPGGGTEGPSLDNLTKMVGKSSMLGYGHAMGGGGAASGGAAGVGPGEGMPSRPTQHGGHQMMMSSAGYNNSARPRMSHSSSQQYHPHPQQGMRPMMANSAGQNSGMRPGVPQSASQQYQQQER